MSAINYEELLRHVGHKIECVSYQLPEERGINPPDNVAIECVTCNEVLFDYEIDSD